MLASITPLGERGRQSRYWVTLSAFLVGAVGAGVGVGLVLGAAGRLLLGGVSQDWRLVLLAIVLLAAVVLDARPGPAPGPRRQVNELWLDRYRGWVYGFGYGAQLGLGMSTIVTSAATYAALAAAFLSAQATTGALILGLAGAVRGLTPALAARVHSPAQLRSLHSELARLQAPVARVGLVVLVVSLVLALMAVVS